MTVHLDVRNESTRKRLYRRDALRRLAERACEGEGVGGAVELSLLLCDDAFIRELNETYRRKKRSTDVLSFAQSGHAEPRVPRAYHGARVLGDIVISLEMADRNCGGDRRAMRDEVRLLFCHGLLHLLGYKHASAGGQKRMVEKQAQYLGISTEAAWRSRRRA